MAAKPLPPEYEEAAIKSARDFLSDFHLGKLDARDITFFLVASVLLRKEALPEERLRALQLLESELYPDGAHFGSLCKGLGLGEPARGRPRKRGGDPFAHGTRDISITNAVNNTHRDFGFRPTRNRAARHKGHPESACSIVTQALRRIGIHMSEDAVEKSWRQGTKLIGLSRHVGNE